MAHLHCTRACSVAGRMFRNSSFGLRFHIRAIRYRLSTGSVSVPQRFHPSRLGTLLRRTTMQIWIRTEQGPIRVFPRSSFCAIDPFSIMLVLRSFTSYGSDVPRMLMRDIPGCCWMSGWSGCRNRYPASRQVERFHIPKHGGVFSLELEGVLILEVNPG